MAGFGPFETNPHLAVAVSGGADSMALCILARDWAAAAGGRVTALTVDHGLRAGSAADAAAVADRMASLGVDHRTLAWLGAKPATAIQERARLARYRLLVGWCRGEGVLHLLLGHHRRDDAETVLFRLMGGSGPHGLAGMAAELETAQVRLLRPLLAAEPEDIRAFLDARGRDWIEDPANRDPRFARSTLRLVLAPGAAGREHRLRRPPPGLRDLIASTTEAAAAARSAMRDAIVALLAAACTLHPTGYAELVRAEFIRAPTEVAVAALARMVTMIGGVSDPPPAERVRRAWSRLRAAAEVATTLGRCRIVARGGGIFVYRDARGLPAPQPIVAERGVLWDGRFGVRLVGDAPPALSEGLRVRPPTQADLRLLRLADAAEARSAAPYLARVTLPVLSDVSGRLLASLPEPSRNQRFELQRMRVECSFRPRISITGAGYFLARDNSCIIC